MAGNRGWVMAVCVLVLGGCSSQDFGRPMGTLTDVLSSGPKGPDPSTAAQAALRAEQLARAMTLWDAQRRTAAADYRVGVHDVLDVSVMALEQPGAYSTLTRPVNQNGNINLPLVGLVQVAGLDLPAITDRIAEAYRAGYLNNPRINVEVKEYRSQPVVITGAVTAPGVVYLRQNSSTVLEVLSMAQGLSPAAGERLLIVRKPAGDDEPPPPTETEETVPSLSDQAAVELAMAEATLLAAASAAEAVATDGEDLEEVRFLADPAAAAAMETTAETDDPNPGFQGTPQMIEVNLERLLSVGDMRLNVTIQGGDIITVPPSVTEYVYVLGYVNSPGAYPLKGVPRISALKAVALANGLAPSARAANSLLIVEEEGRRRVTPVDLPAIARGAIPPTYMEPGDTLIVGSSALAKIGEFIKPTVSAGASYSPVP